MSFTEIEKSDIPALKKEFLPEFSSQIAYLNSAESKIFSAHYSEQFIEGVDFDLTYTPIKHALRKMIINVCGHLFSLHATPNRVGIVISIPNRVSKEMVEEMAEAVQLSCKELKISTAFVELRPSYGAIIFGIHAYGTFKETKFAKISKKDAVVVTGSLGAAFAGLQVLLDAKKEWENDPDGEQPDISDFAEVVKAQLYPEPLFELFDGFNEIKVSPAHIRFISLGFLQALSSITMDDFGIEVHEETLPVTNETHRVSKKFEQSAYDFALKGGEDYEFVFILNEKDLDRLRNYVPQCRIVGYITDNKELRIVHNDGQIDTFS